MRKKKLTIGILAVVAIFSFNFNHAFNNYGVLSIKAQGIFTGSNPAYTSYTSYSSSNSQNLEKYYYVVRKGMSIKK